ncbi:MAG: hypothetical protein WD823_09625 [Sulfuricaulis sp.]|uniref:hypothetical protein n=1 Tax=Sulfuricaulis sp. TaxID=2003553 RepID=UPI0034A5809F
MKSSHKNMILAESAACTVEHCLECDVVHLHFGHASVRLRPAVFMAACQTLTLAMRRMTPQEVDATSAKQAFGDSSCH